MHESKSMSDLRGVVVSDARDLGFMKSAEEKR